MTGSDTDISPQIEIFAKEAICRLWFVIVTLPEFFYLLFFHQQKFGRNIPSILQSIRPYAASYHFRRKQPDTEKTVIYWIKRHIAGWLFVAFFFLKQLVLRRFFVCIYLYFLLSFRELLLTGFYCTALYDFISLLSNA